MTEAAKAITVMSCVTHNDRCLHRCHRSITRSFGFFSRPKRDEIAQQFSDDSHYVSATITRSDGDYGVPEEERSGAGKCHTAAEKNCPRVRRAGPVRSSVLQTGPAVWLRRALGVSGHGFGGVTHTMAYALSRGAHLMVIETPYATPASRGLPVPSTMAPPPSVEP